jgi:hypothetical protein
VEPEETYTARQRFDKHVPAATNAQGTIEGLLGNSVFCWVSPEAHNEDPRRADDD